jgi:hypothetical protein
MKIVDRKDAIHRRFYNNQSFVETAIYRLSSLNRTVLNYLLPNSLNREDKYTHEHEKNAFTK